MMLNFCVACIYIYMMQEGCNSSIASCKTPICLLVFIKTVLHSVVSCNGGRKDFTDENVDVLVVSTSSFLHSSAFKLLTEHESSLSPLLTEVKPECCYWCMLLELKPSV